jgi:hypothetical protein
MPADIPLAYAATMQVINSIVSKTDSPAVMEPPGELM